MFHGRLSIIHEINDEGNRVPDTVYERLDVYLDDLNKYLAEVSRIF